MNLQEFKASVGQKKPPESLAKPLEALWWDAKGDWNAAHKCAMGANGKDGAWVHAYLHRKEGDLSNAGYWYKRADKSAPSISLEAEWEAIAKALLAA